MKPQSCTVIFSGRVQGVGFRMTAVRLAKPLELAGTVRNLGSGDVELVAVGQPAKIDGLVRQLCEHFDASARIVLQATADSVPDTAFRILH